MLTLTIIATIIAGITLLICLVSVFVFMFADDTQHLKSLKKVVALVYTFGAILCGLYIVAFWMSYLSPEETSTFVVAIISTIVITYGLIASASKNQFITFLFSLLYLAAIWLPILLAHGVSDTPNLL